MIEKTFVVTTKLGIHARPALELVNIAAKSKSDIKVSSNNQKVDMKSIMGLMSLGMYNGQHFTLIIEGEDEKETINSLTKHLIDNNLANII